LRSFVTDSLQPNKDYNQSWEIKWDFFSESKYYVLSGFLPAHVINTTAIDAIESQKTCKNGECHT
jgi:hypothetical protein